MKIIKDNLVLLFYGFSIAFAFLGISLWINSLTQDHGLISIDGQYIGRDFLPFYAAAKQVIAGNIRDLYTEFGAYRATHLIVPELAEEKISHWPWPYPPHYFLLLSPFAILPYYYAITAWLILSLLLPCFLFLHYWRVRGAFFIAAILNINLFYCLSMGQNSLILASIAGIAIASINKCPVLAGVCFSIVSMKPHFAVVLPIALLFGRYWQVLFYTITSTLFLMLITSLFFGFDIWLIALEQFSSVKDISFSPDIEIFTIYSAYRSLLWLGFSSTYFWIFHFLIVFISLFLLQYIWRRKDCSLEIKWLAFGISSVLITPFSFAYDAVWITLPALVFLYNSLANKNKKTSPIIYSLLLLQIFAFAVISINKLFALPIIIGALLLLFLINRHRK